MWPGKNVHLTYGVDGTCTFDRASNSFDFPRVRDTKSERLRPLKSSYHCLVPAQLDQRSADIDTGSIKMASEIAEHTEDTYFVPKSLLKAGHQESLAAQDRKIHDPTFGDMLAILHYDAHKVSASLLISTTGSYGNILAVSILDSAGMPSTTKAIQFNSRIKQIFTFPETRHFGVRTNVSVSIFEVHVESRFGVGVARLVEIPQKSLAGQAFADACVCSHMEAYIALIDVKGNFGLFKLIKRDLDRSFNDYKRLYLSTIHDPAELSNFKRVRFAQQNDQLLLMSRSSLHVWSPAQQVCKVVANYWSRLLDLCVPAGQHDHCILLTTREISLVQLSGFEPALSWSHHLDGQDLSLKLMVQKYKDRFECHIISQINSLVLVVTFGFLRGKARIFGDSYFYVPHPTEPVQSIAFLNYGTKFAFFQLTRDLEISRMQMERSERDVEVPDKKLPREQERIPALPQLHDIKANNCGNEVEKLLEQFAANENEMFFSLGSMVPTAGPLPGNLESLIAQNELIVYDASERLFSDVGQIQRLHSLPEGLLRPLRPFENRASRLKSILQNKTSPCLDRINTNLGLSLLTVHKKHQGDRGIEEIRSQLPFELAALLDQWRPHEPQGTSIFSHAEPLSQVPVITTSQKSKKKLKARPSKLAGFSQQFSQARSPMSSQLVPSSSQINTSSPASFQIASPPSSQPEPPVSSHPPSSLPTQSSSSQKKRKKRKLGGFM
ncbi:hypothetical protein KL935_003623 [Ogataea polymorpha]|uniref:uncharacterized protein n=1 Tax=Ogataea polymorpha TaxID=460523 RepID=UPI0007F373F5|nr:uncharacterized protein OGAPODRAFT_10233 [Ogataea polymorpha]KAG7878994.1 hypothetical protein KL937_003407 [Ogataea polymorpha]KAG7899313.1 hypothetical protein KL935_003623 [Ogataea polymorpha]KAG7934254.1 hypothetical protein KL904_003588 [Ogataea polymorpha]OBA13566.1 hypothetical protein OGAPODRAFT_10233 [Ogataea polymorpha]